jgi:hypothetical protein
MGVKLAIKRTINYAKYFESHININEIKNRLISKKVYPERLIENEVSKLNLKNKKNIWKKIKIVRAKKLAKLIKKDFKDIIFVGVSGSVAAAHPKKNDDIDLLVITKNNTLWKNRFLLRWWIFRNKIPHRKFNQSQLRDQFCFNLWLDENYLEIPKGRQNLKNAVDLILLKPLVNKNYAYERLVLANDWAAKFVATGYSKKISDISCRMSDKTKIKKKYFK